METSHLVSIKGGHVIAKNRNKVVLLKCRSVQSAVTAEVESGGSLVALLSLIAVTFLISIHYKY